MNNANCASMPLPVPVPVLLPQYSGSSAMALPLLLPAPVISFTPSPRATPSPSPLNVFAFPQVSPRASPSPSPMNVLPFKGSLTDLLGDYFTISDSCHPEKYKNADPSNSPLRSIVQENDTVRVFFSELNGSDQFAQIRVAPDGRFQLFSTQHNGYSFYLVTSEELMPDLLRWQNEYNPLHFVDWRRVDNRLSLCRGYSRPVSRRNSIVRESAKTYMLRTPSVSFEETILPEVEDTPELEPYSVSLLKSTMEQQRSRPRRDSSRSSDSLPLEAFSRETSPESKDRLPLNIRDSKQNLVTRVEPEVNALIDQYFAEEKDYRFNQKGRWGPPVLRGEDVLFIPAKKQAALENVTKLIETVLATSTIVAASMVNQKKKKRQKKGFLVYLKLASADEVKNFLEGPYRQLGFETTVQGAKMAVFDK